MPVGVRAAVVKLNYSEESMPTVPSPAVFVCSVLCAWAA